MQKIEDAIDRVVDLGEEAMDLGMDALEKVGDKLEQSWLAHQIIKRYDRRGFIDPRLISGSSDEYLLSVHQRMKAFTGLLEEEKKFIAASPTGNEVQDRRVLDEQNALIEGNARDLEILLTEIKKRGLENAAEIG